MGIFLVLFSVMGIFLVLFSVMGIFLVLFSVMGIFLVLFSVNQIKGGNETEHILLHIHCILFLTFNKVYLIRYLNDTYIYKVKKIRMYNIITEVFIWNSWANKITISSNRITSTMSFRIIDVALYCQASYRIITMSICIVVLSFRIVVMSLLIFECRCISDNNTRQYETTLSNFATILFNSFVINTTESDARQIKLSDARPQEVTPSTIW
jgi:hypothetical protein